MQLHNLTSSILMGWNLRWRNILLQGHHFEALLCLQGFASITWGPSRSFIYLVCLRNVQTPHSRSWFSNWTLAGHTPSRICPPNFVKIEISYWEIFFFRIWWISNLVFFQNWEQSLISLKYSAFPSFIFCWVVKVQESSNWADEHNK